MFSELALEDLCATRGLKLRSRPKTRTIPFHALLVKDEVKLLNDGGSNRTTRNDAPWICDWPGDEEWLWLRDIHGLEGGLSPRLCFLRSVGVYYHR
jgi:hypothetical protein